MKRHFLLKLAFLPTILTIGIVACNRSFESPELLHLNKTYEKHYKIALNELGSPQLRLCKNLDIVQDFEQISIDNSYIDISTEQMLSELNVSEITKELLISFKQAFIDDGNSLNIEEIEALNISTEEKEILTQALAIKDAISNSPYITSPFTVGPPRNPDKYEKAVMACYKTYQEELGEAIIRGVVAGVIGIAGGPAVAGFSLGTVGISEVLLAYSRYRRCLDNAKKNYNCALVMDINGMPKLP